MTEISRVSYPFSLLAILRHVLCAILVRRGIDHSFFSTENTKVVGAASPNPHPMVANRLPHSYLIHSNQVNTQDFASLAV